ncbi:RBBP9/YdeN family alpha/beta hydrolase [Gordonia sp. (in: high G+C Gram-positive bacteria)]|uniref:RBBP9/YdeN family alpha/beta hydrolase n=1 Tax=Gordonia sp. (in: high G+C Gram-positive bacteria) TaxID=84139 RepID=UPI003C75097F
MVAQQTPTYVIVPGLRGHVEDHWQTILAGQLQNSVIVPQVEGDPIQLDARLALLESVVAAQEAPVILVAHSAGVPTTVFWAAQTKLPVAGALLATPPDLTQEMHAPHPTLEQLSDAGWGPVPMDTLPWPSIVVSSTNDPLASTETVAEYAQSWGSTLVEGGEVGHLNPASGYGPWPRAVELLAQLQTLIGMDATVQTKDA